MLIVRNYKQGVVVGETDKSYRVRQVAPKEVWWPKAQCRQDFDFYAAQLAIHLWHGYQTYISDDSGSINTVAELSRFVPALILADRKLGAQIDAGRDDWSKVFCYDVAQTAGAWLAANPKADVAAFTAYVETLIA